MSEQTLLEVLNAQEEATIKQIQQHYAALRQALESASESLMASKPKVEAVSTPAPASAIPGIPAIKQPQG